MSRTRGVTCSCRNLVTELLTLVALLLLLPAIYLVAAIAAHLLLGIPYSELLAADILFWMLFIIFLLFVKNVIVIYKYVKKAAETGVLDTPGSALAVALHMLVHSGMVLWPVLLDDLLVAFGAAFSRTFAVLALADVTPGVYDMLTELGKTVADLLNENMTITIWPGHVQVISYSTIVLLATKVVIIVAFLWNDIWALLTRLGASTALMISCIKLASGPSKPQRDAGQLAISALCGDVSNLRVHKDAVRILVELLVRLRSVVNEKSVIHALRGLAKLLEKIGEDVSIVESAARDLRRTVGVKWYVVTLFTLAIDFTISLFILLA